MFKRPNETTKVECVREFPTPNVYIDTLALMKMSLYVEKCSEEVAWLGVVEEVTQGEKLFYLVTDVMLVKQTTSGTKADMDESALADLGTELIKSGKTDVFSKIKCWGHSHVNMHVSPSGTDEDTWEQFYKNNDYFIRIIANKKGELKLDFMDSISGIKYINVSWYENMSEERKQLELLLQELEKKEQEKLELMKADIELEIDNNIVKQSTHYGKGLNNHSNYYSYMDYDNFGTHQSRHSTKHASQNTNTKHSKKNFEIKTSELYGKDLYICDWTEIDEIFSDEEIIDYVENNYTVMELRDNVEKEELSEYTFSDWQTLKEVMEEYYKHYYIVEL